MSNSPQKTAPIPATQAPLKPRTLEEVNAEYREACMRLGDAEYKSFNFSTEITALKHKLRALSQEAMKLQAQAVLAQEAKPEHSSVSQS